MTDADRPAQAARARAATLLDLHHRAEEWRGVAEEAIAVDPASLRRRTRKCAILREAASRPPTVGVFGESQVGKSFLISRFTGSPAGIVVQDPSPVSGADVQPWTEETRAFGGLRFIEWINAQTGGESTALVCRFTRHPADVPRKPGMFVARLMNHEDLITSLCIGYLSAVPSDPRSGDLVDRLTAAVDQVRSTPAPVGSPERLIDLEAAYRYVLARHESDPYVTALADVGFPLLIDELIKSRRSPMGAQWTTLVGMLWGVGRNPVLDEVYQRLEAKLIAFSGAAAVEIPVAAVIKHQGQRPLTDVSLLDDLLMDKASIAVWAQAADGVSRIEITRPELSAIVLELVLPVTRDANDPYMLLDQADVLDFPGARADPRSGNATPTDRADALKSAMEILRRGKLSRVFATLSERREINVLCLAARAGNLEASGPITRLLRHWFSSQAASIRPDLFVALTQCDLTLQAYPTAKWPPDTGGLGELVKQTKRKYASEGPEFLWMDRFPPDASVFTNVYFVYNPAIPTKTDWQDVAGFTDHALSDKVVNLHVASARKKLEALIGGDGGVGLLVMDVLEAVTKHGKFDRLAAELRTMRDDLASTLRPHYVDLASAGGRADPSGEAMADIDVVVSACSSAMENRSLRNPLSVLLEAMRLTPGVLRNELRRLEYSHSAGATNGPVAPTRANFVEAISKAWTRGLAARFADETFQADVASLGIPNTTLQSILRGWTTAVTQPWMRDAMAGALDPYFSAAVGPSNVRDGLLNAAQWAWNRHLVALGAELPSPEPVPLPPRLSDPARPSWHWLTEHWRRVLPGVYAGGRSPAKWNDELGAILAELDRLEISA